MTRQQTGLGDDISLGFDLGGTNMRAALFRGLGAAVPVAPGFGPPAAATPIARHREPVGDDRRPEAIVDRLATIARTLLQDSELGALQIPLGIGFAGMLSGQAGRVANSPHFGWRGVELGTLLRQRLGDRYSVGVYNDVNAICYGEYAVGAGAGAQDILAIFIGTGIGGGAICAGNLLEGANNTACEIGHTKVIVDESARPCACGLKGCIEAYVGGHKLQERIRWELGPGGRRSAAVRLAGGPERVNPGHLDQAASRGDDYALELYEEISPLLGLTIANAVTMMNPQRLVLGGGMFCRTPVLREHALAAFEVAVNPPALVGLQIVDAGLGEDGGLIGSALLAARPAQ